MERFTQARRALRPRRQKNEEAKNEDEDEGEEASRLLKFTNFTPVTQL